LQIALNEQFMVLSLGPADAAKSATRKEGSPEANVVLQTIREYLGAHKTFGENLIFILNRCGLPPPAAFRGADLAGRRLIGGPLRLIVDPQDPLPPLHHTVHARVLLHERPLRSRRRLSARVDRLAGGK
jgi:hypothetical protein